MNGYQIIAENYRDMADKGMMDKAQAEKKCKVLDFLAGCDDTDICNLFDSTAFNELTMCYVRRAARNLTETEVIDDEQAMAIRNEVYALFSDCNAEQIQK